MLIVAVAVLIAVAVAMAHGFQPDGFSDGGYW
jgi:hypothetical protein